MTLEISCLSKSFSVLNASHSPPRKLFSRFFVAIAGGLRFETLGALLRGDGLLGVNGALVGLVGRNGRRGLDLALASKLCRPAGLWVGLSLLDGALPEEASWFTSEPC